MASIKNEITIRFDYRPCIVENRDINGRIVKNRCLFHVIDKDGKAIVEFEDGRVHRMDPTLITFVDDLTKQYSFRTGYRRDRIDAARDQLETYIKMFERDNVFLADESRRSLDILYDMVI